MTKFEEALMMVYWLVWSWFIFQKHLIRLTTTYCLENWISLVFSDDTVNWFQSGLSNQKFSVNWRIPFQKFKVLYVVYHKDLNLVLYYIWFILIICRWQWNAIFLYDNDWCRVFQSNSQMLRISKSS